MNKYKGIIMTLGAQAEEAGYGEYCVSGGGIERKN